MMKPPVRFFALLLLPVLLVASAQAAIIGSATATGLGAAVSGGTVAGATTAFNVDINNRQLHPDESQILANLQQGKSPDEQQNLADAACYLVHCSSGMNPQDPGYAAAVASQARGADDTAEQAQLQAAGNWHNNISTTDLAPLTNAFTYSFSDALSDTINDTYYDPIGTIKSAGNGAFNLLTSIVNAGPGNTQVPLNPDSNYYQSPTAGAVVTPPVIVCTAPLLCRSCKTPSTRVSAGAKGPNVTPELPVFHAMPLYFWEFPNSPC